MHQLTASTSTSILQDTATPLLHLTAGSIMSLCKFLHEADCHLILDFSCPPNPPRKNDHYLMDTFLHPQLPTAKLKQLNACCLYLKAITLSDICDSHGSNILKAAMLGTTITTSTSTYQWPRQHHPTKHAWMLWCTTLCPLWLQGCRYTMHPHHWL